MKALAVLLSLTLMWGVGCRRQSPERSPAEEAADFGRLPGLRTTTDLALRDELARLEDEKATPELLMHDPVAPQENIAAGLEELFVPTKLPRLHAQAADLFPSDAFTFTPLGLEKALRFKNRYISQRQQAREMLQRPVCDFRIPYTAGFGADLTCIDQVQLCARLEAFEAADCLRKSDVDGAVEAVRQMLRWASCLAGEKHATVRLQGAFTRTEALTVLQAVVEHPKFARKHVEQLSAIFRELLALWPNDADAWRGDRAIGLHTYELVRAGQAMSLLTETDVTQFREEGILADFAKRAKTSVNQDERYYLQAMRRLIEACSQPYYARAQVFADLRNDLQQRLNSPDYPIVAARLLLTDVERGQRVQAQDRANCEAWALALALATGQPTPDAPTNPLTGQKYRILREKGWIEIGNISISEDGKQVTVTVRDWSEPPSK